MLLRNRVLVGFILLASVPGLARADTHWPSPPIQNAGIGLPGEASIHTQAGNCRHFVAKSLEASARYQESIPNRVIERRFEVLRNCELGYDNSGRLAFIVQIHDLVRYDGKVSIPHRYVGGTRHESLPIIPSDLAQGKGLGVSHCGTRCVGNPINLSSLNKFQRETDYAGPAGSRLRFERFYNSLPYVADSRHLGPGWRHSYSRSVKLLPAGAVVYRDSGEFYLFARQGKAWRPDSEINLRLTQTGDAGWEIVDPSDNSIERYDSTGRLQSIRFVDGGFTELAYSKSGRLEAIVDESGRAIALSYSSDGHLQSVADSGGAVTHYSYSPEILTGAAGAVRNLVGVTYPGGAQRTYVYQTDIEAPLMIEIRDDGLTYARFGYDGWGYATLTEHALGVDRYQTGWDSVTEPGGLKVGYSFFNANGARFINRMSRAGRSETYTYDANLRRDKTTDFAGVVTDEDYNDGGLLTSRIDAANSPRDKRTTQIDWHAGFAVPIERRTYDAANTLVAKQRWVYNARGQALTASKIDPVSGAARIVSTAYCEKAQIHAGACPREGLVTSVDGQRAGDADRTSYVYRMADGVGCGVSPATCTFRKGDLWKVIRAGGHVMETLRYDGAGRVLSVKDANGVVTDFEYHPRGWLTARKVRGVDPATEADDQITRIDYYPTGLVSSTTLPDGSFTSYVYDAAHRLIDIVDADGNRIHYTLDNAGNPIKEEVRGSDDSLKRTVSRVYNQLGQLQITKDARNHPTGFTYDAKGNPDTTTDALGRVLDNDYDPLDRLSRTLQDVGGINAETRFRYDAQDNLTEVIDPKGLSTRYTYNAFGDLTKLESPDTGVTTYGYDSAGIRTNALDARGEPASYGYDALNRLTSIGYSDTSLNVAYIYDAVQPECTAAESFAIGRLTRMNDGSGNTRYCYDRFGNLTRKVQVTNGQTFALRYAYTKAGQLSGMEYPDGTVVDYVRDALGRATEVGVALPGSPRQVLLTGATYHPFGPISGWKFGNGRTMVRTLDLDYRPKTILSTGTGAGGLNLGYGWDAVGNVASLHTSEPEQPPKVTFGYDALNRLTEFQDGPTGVAIEQYRYDATGNRTSFTNATGTEPYTYAADSHRLAAVGSAQRSYDAMGNTTSIDRTAREFAYNAAGRLSQVERDNVVAMSYAYNGRGEQVGKQLAARSAYAIYDEAGHWVGEYDNNGGPTQQVIWLDELPVGLIGNAQVSYIEPDHLGTPRAVIEPLRDVAVWTWDLAGEAFGNSAPSQDPDADTVQFELGMRLPGQIYDYATGLNHNYFRDYDVSIGRYAESDPIGLEGGISTFTYVVGNPFVAIDADGLNAIVLPWAEPMVTPKPLVTPLDPVLPLTAPNDPSSNDFCRRLAERIKNATDEIYRKRWLDLLTNPLGLPWRIGPGEKLRETVRGHEKLLNRRLRELKNLEDEYDQKCRQVACLQ